MHAQSAAQQLCLPVASSYSSWLRPSNVNPRQYLCQAPMQAQSPWQMLLVPAVAVTVSVAPFAAAHTS
jgi:hypothetical protein